MSGRPRINAAGRLRIEKLCRSHAVEGFTCGREPLDIFLVRHALVSQQANASQTYVAVSESSVVGYFTLVFGEVTRDAAPPRIAKGLPRHPVPIMVLARLAIAVDWQRRGVGSGLLKDAILRMLRAADLAGLRALVVHAKDEATRGFYERFDFVLSPSDPLHLFVLIKDLKASV
ncbi:MAG: GNAT family N-acetyltransferase [Planctomycetota bacterium]